MKPLLCICIQVAMLFPLIQGQCRLQFINEPPSELDCNPFNETVNSVSVLCVLVRASGEDTFSVDWYHNNTNGSVTKISTYNTILDSTIYVTRLVLDSFNESMIGEYFCQATNTTDNDSVVLNPSNKLYIQEPESYQGVSPCPSVVLDSTPTVKCADLNSSKLTPTILSSLLLSSATAKTTILYSCSPTTAVFSNSEVGWIVGFVITLLLALLLSLILLIFIIIITCRKYQKNLSSMSKSNMPIIYKKTKPLESEMLTSSQAGITMISSVSDTNTTPQPKPVLIHQEHSAESYDYVDWSTSEELQSSYVDVHSDTINSPVYINPNSPQPNHSNTTCPEPPIKTVEGKVYAIADLNKRDNRVSYQKIKK